MPLPRWVPSSRALTWCQHLHTWCTLRVHPCASTPGLLPRTFQTPDRLAAPLATARASVHSVPSCTAWTDAALRQPCALGRAVASVIRAVATMQLLSSLSTAPVSQAWTLSLFPTLAIRDVPLPHPALGVSWRRVLVGPEWVAWGLECPLVRLPRAF